MRAFRVPFLIRPLGAVLVAALLSLGALATFLRSNRPVPPEVEQDEIYSLAIASMMTGDRDLPTALVRVPVPMPFFSRQGAPDPTQVAHVWPLPETGAFLLARDWLLSILASPHRLGYVHPFGPGVRLGALRFAEDTFPWERTLAFSRIRFHPWRRRAAVLARSSPDGSRPDFFSSGEWILLERDGCGVWQVVGRGGGWISG